MSAALSQDDCPWAEPEVATGKGGKGLLVGAGLGVQETGSALHTRHVYLVETHFATLHLLPFLSVCCNLWTCLLKIVHA